jgi:hypothetical protein
LQALSLLSNNIVDYEKIVLPFWQTILISAKKNVSWFDKKLTFPSALKVGTLPIF